MLLCQNYLLILNVVEIPLCWAKLYDLHSLILQKSLNVDDYVRGVYYESVVSLLLTFKRVVPTLVNTVVCAKMEGRTSPVTALGLGTMERHVTLVIVGML